MTATGNVCNFYVVTQTCSARAVGWTCNDASCFTAYAAIDTASSMATLA